MREKTKGLTESFLVLAVLLIFAPATVNAADCGQGTAKPACGCGDTVMGNFTFAGDLTCPTGIGLSIGADGVVVDGADYLLNGSAATGCVSYDNPGNDHIGIYNNGYDDVIIRNLEILNFCKGIFVTGTPNGINPADNNLIEYNHIHHCGDSTVETNDNGILLMLSVTNTVVQENDIHDIDGLGDASTSGGNAIFMEGPDTDYNIITRNFFYHNRKDGFIMRKESDHNDITYNEAYENGRGGIILRCKLSDDNIIKFNYIHYNSGDGIFIGGNRNLVEYNAIFNSEAGFLLGSTDIVGDGDGIDIGRDDGSRDNELKLNMSCTNEGIDIDVIDDTYGNFGDENSCGTTNNYDDEGTTGCTQTCGGTIYRCENNLASADGACGNLDCESTVCGSGDPPLPKGLACKDLNGEAGPQCPGTSGNYGDIYHFVDWKDVIFVAYLGFHHDGTIDCNSDIRHALAGNPSVPATGGFEPLPLDCENDCWESFFMKDFALDCEDENCNVNWHIWRQGSMSGSATIGTKTLTFCNGGDTEDNDPIRRPVHEKENIPGRTDLPLVISPDPDDCVGEPEVVYGVPTLGWLLPAVVPPQYEGKNTNPCKKGNFGWYNVPFATRPTCEDGAPSVFGLCLIPLDDNNMPGCCNMKDNFAMLTPLDSDTRSTNMVQRDNMGRIVTDARGDDVMNAFYNIHCRTSLSESPPCNWNNATDQIACLTVASPCSIGLAGEGAEANVPESLPLEICGVVM